MSIWATCTLAAALSTGCTRSATEPLDIATTSSVHNSGLLDALLPAYKEQTGVQVRVHAAGSGLALQLLSEGLTQLVISHAPDAEARALAEHPTWIRRPLATNWFVIVGPRQDRAGVRDASDVADAFRRIANSDVPFVSRGDRSGTHERELALWDMAGQRPATAHYVISGKGMATALRHADELQAYTLTDEATYWQLAPRLELETVFRGGEPLLNVYSVIYPPDDARAAAFGEWLAAGDGRTRIGQFTIAGKQAFELIATP
jgi:tungstate transport system substrate-binding protein